jgi:ribosomal protein S18 acetylase RimI-like enzyme
VDPLGNPIWHALGGAQRMFAESVGNARRCLPEMSPFTGLPDEPVADDWDALRELVGPGSTALLLRDPLEIPEAWETTFHLSAVQMIADAHVDGTDTRVSALDAARLDCGDVQQMIDLVARTNPGPFERGTIRFGAYLGVRRDGRLVAMAGERFRPAGHTEVSAVCTDPAFRGQGLAAALVWAVMDLIRERDERPMLHAAADNTNAIRLYASLGFRHSRDVEGAAVRAPA